MGHVDTFSPIFLLLRLSVHAGSPQSQFGLEILKCFLTTCDGVVHILERLVGCKLSWVGCFIQLVFEQAQLLESFSATQDGFCLSGVLLTIRDGFHQPLIDEILFCLNLTVQGLLQDGVPVCDGDRLQGCDFLTFCVDESVEGFCLIASRSEADHHVHKIRDRFFQVRPSEESHLRSWLGVPLELG